MLAVSPGDALLRPQPLEMLPFTLNRLTISLQPSLEQFEGQLLQLINADCRNTVSFHNTQAYGTVRWDETVTQMSCWRTSTLGKHPVQHMVRLSATTNLFDIEGKGSWQHFFGGGTITGTVLFKAHMVMDMVHGTWTWTDVTTPSQALHVLLNWAEAEGLQFMDPDFAKKWFENTDEGFWSLKHIHKRFHILYCHKCITVYVQ